MGMFGIHHSRLAPPHRLDWDFVVERHQAACCWSG